MENLTSETSEPTRNLGRFHLQCPKTAKITRDGKSSTKPRKPQLRSAQFHSLSTFTEPSRSI